jgi:diguanylate cyclase (GGDEF)-like protein
MANWAAQLQSIQQLGTRLTRLRSVDDIGQTICSELTQLIESHNIRVYRVIGDECVPVAWRGEIGAYEGEDQDQLRVQVGQGITGWVARHGMAQNLGNAAVDPRTQTIPGTEDDLDESLLLAPMLFDDEVIGVIVLAKVGLNQFGPDDLRVLEIYASIAAQAMANADATEKLREQSEALGRQLKSQRELLRVTESILTTLDPQTLLHEIAERLQTIIPVDNMAVSVHDLGARRLHSIFARGLHAAEYLKEDIPDDAGLSGAAVTTGEALLVPDELSDPRVLHLETIGPQSGAVICAPLLSGEGVQGVLTLERLGADATFSDEEFELVKLFAAHVSVALRNATVHRAVELRASTDRLTGLLNHGALTEHMERLVSEHRRFAMLMVDLDFFKRYNDSHGHQAGNVMLQRVAEVLRSSCRDSDLVFRFGGDEFAILLPATGLGGARVFAEKIHTAIGRVSGESANGLSISCSVGIGVYPRDGHDAMSVVIAADRACYAAKRSGRDRIATAADGLALASDFRPTEPTPVELLEPAYSAA